MRVRLVLLLVAVLPLCNAFGQEREDLRIQAPPTWVGWKKAAEQKKDGLEFTAWVPLDQEGSAWKESVTLAILEPSPPVDPVTNAIRLTLGATAKACHNSNVVPPKSRSEGIFTLAYAQFYCARFQGRNVGELTFVKAISSARRTYVISIMKRVKPFEIRAPGAFEFSPEDEDPLSWLSAAGNYLGTVKVCVSRQDKEDVCSP